MANEKTPDQLDQVGETVDRESVVMVSEKAGSTYALKKDTLAGLQRKLVNTAIPFDATQTQTRHEPVYSGNVSIAEGSSYQVNDTGLISFLGTSLPSVANPISVASSEAVAIGPDSTITFTFEGHGGWLAAFSPGNSDPTQFFSDYAKTGNPDLNSPALNSVLVLIGSYADQATSGQNVSAYFLPSGIGSKEDMGVINTDLVGKVCSLTFNADSSITLVVDGQAYTTTTKYTGIGATCKAVIAGNPSSTFNADTTEPTLGNGQTFQFGYIEYTDATLPAGLKDGDMLSITGQGPVDGSLAHVGDLLTKRGNTFVRQPATNAAGKQYTYNAWVSGKTGVLIDPTYTHIAPNNKLTRGTTGSYIVTQTTAYGDPVATNLFDLYSTLTSELTGPGTPSQSSTIADGYWFVIPEECDPADLRLTWPEGTTDANRVAISISGTTVTIGYAFPYAPSEQITGIAWGYSFYIQVNADKTVSIITGENTYTTTMQYTNLPAQFRYVNFASGATTTFGTVTSAPLPAMNIGDQALVLNDGYCEGWPVRRDDIIQKTASGHVILRNLSTVELDYLSVNTLPLITTMARSYSISNPPQDFQLVINDTGTGFNNFKTIGEALRYVRQTKLLGKNVTINFDKIELGADDVEIWLPLENAQELRVNLPSNIAFSQDVMDNHTKFVVGRSGAAPVVVNIPGGDGTDTLPPQPAVYTGVTFGSSLGGIADETDTTKIPFNNVSFAACEFESISSFTVKGCVLVQAAGCDGPLAVKKTATQTCDVYVAGHTGSINCTDASLQFSYNSSPSAGLPAGSFWDNAIALQQLVLAFTQPWTAPTAPVSVNGVTVNLLRLSVYGWDFSGVPLVGFSGGVPSQVTVGAVYLTNCTNQVDTAFADISINQLTPNGYFVMPPLA